MLISLDEVKKKCIFLEELKVLKTFQKLMWIYEEYHLILYEEISPNILYVWYECIILPLTLRSRMNNWIF